MAKKGRRERFRRKVRDARIKAGSLSLGGASKPEVQNDALRYLSRSQKRHLLGSQLNPLEPKAAQAKSHTLNAYVGRSPGSGKPERARVDRRNTVVAPEMGGKRIRNPQGRIFATNFMAAGHEGNKTTKQDNRTMVRVGTSPARTVVTVDKITKEKKVFKIAASPKWREVGRAEAIPSIE